MKKTIALLVATAAVVATPAFAQSDDATFTGPRIEALAGWDTSRAGSDIDNDNPNTNDDQSIDGLGYGVGLGYDFATNGLVFGVEGEYMESNADTDLNTDDYNGFGIGQVETGRDLYLGARVGAIVAPGMLLYAKGGYTNARYNVLASDGTTDTETNVDLDGWRVGAGAEYALSEKAFLRAEYRYSNYSKGEVDGPNMAESDRFGVDVDRHQVMAGVGLRF